MSLHRQKKSAIDVTQLSGHKNVDSLRAYHQTSLEKQRKISALINNNDRGKQPLKDVTNNYHPISSSSQNNYAKNSFIHHPISSSSSGNQYKNCTFNYYCKPPSESTAKRRKMVIYDTDEE